MRIFLYEFVTGGGWCFESPPPDSLLRQAKAMIQALATDFGELAECEVTVLEDARWPLDSLSGVNKLRSDPPNGSGNLPDLLRVAGECDASLIIAPAFWNCLYRCVEALENYGRQLLSPPSCFVYIASDKVLTYRNIADYVRTPRTARVRCTFDGQLPEGMQYPLVVKPIDGCGSDGVQLLQTADDCIDWSFMSEYLDDVAVQDFVQGTAASVAVLCGPFGVYPLPACIQRLSDDGRFQYLGGECPLTASLSQRADHIARRALGALRPVCGYVGVDLVLGEAADGSEDYIIEINPRLTTSYIGLRALADCNLAQAMFDMALGKEPELRWKPGSVRWSAEGAVEYVAP